MSVLVDPDILSAASAAGSEAGRPDLLGK